MTNTPHIETAAEAEDRAEQARASRIRFQQTIFGGTGAALIFGLVSSVCISLVHALPLITAANLFTAATLLPLGGLVAVAAVGLSCIYMGSKLLSKVVCLEQEGQARKIHEAAKGKEQDIPVLQSEHIPTVLPSAPALSESVAQEAALPATRIDASTTQLMDQAPAKAAAQSWADRVVANDASPQTAVAMGA